MSTYAGVSFKVLGDGGQYPTVERTSDGVRTYRATIQLASRSARDALAATLSIVTWARVYGTTSATFFVEGGPGAGPLAVPIRAGSLSSYTAFLTGLSNIRADGRQSQRFFADAEWVLTT